MPIQFSPLQSHSAAANMKYAIAVRAELVQNIFVNDFVDNCAFLTVFCVCKYKTSNKKPNNALIAQGTDAYCTDERKASFVNTTNEALMHSTVESVRKKHSKDNIVAQNYTIIKRKTKNRKAHSIIPSRSYYEFGCVLVFVRVPLPLLCALCAHACVRSTCYSIACVYARILAINLFFDCVRILTLLLLSLRARVLVR